MKAVQRLNKHTISILERYDHDTDTAIQKMESTIQMLQNVTKNQQNPAFSHAIIAKSGEKPVQNAPINGGMICYLCGRIIKRVYYLCWGHNFRFVACPVCGRKEGGERREL